MSKADDFFDGFEPKTLKVDTIGPTGELRAEIARLTQSLAETQRTIATKDEERERLSQLVQMWIQKSRELIAERDSARDKSEAKESENAALHSRIAELESQLVTAKQSFEDFRIAGQASITEALAAAIEQTQRVNELESQVAAYHAAAARVAGDALRARNDALEEAAKECDAFAEAYSSEFFRPLPEKYIYSADETRAAALFAYGRFKVAAAKIRALSGTEGGEVVIKSVEHNQENCPICSGRALSGSEGGTSK